MESDSKVAIELIKHGVNPEHQLAGLVYRIRQLLSNEDWNCQVQHVFREANGVADWLANHAHSFPRGVVEFCSCPAGCADRALVDTRGVCFTRLISP